MDKVMKRKISANLKIIVLQSLLNYEEVLLCPSVMLSLAIVFCVILKYIIDIDILFNLYLTLHENINAS